VLAEENETLQKPNRCPNLVADFDFLLGPDGLDGQTAGPISAFLHSLFVGARNGRSCFFLLMEDITEELIESVRKQPVLEEIPKKEDVVV
jgi:hypothetical protein